MFLIQYLIFIMLKLFDNMDIGGFNQSEAQISLRSSFALQN